MDSGNLTVELDGGQVQAGVVAIAVFDGQGDTPRDAVITGEEGRAALALALRVTAAVNTAPLPLSRDA